MKLPFFNYKKKDFEDLELPKNQHEQVLYYLYTWSSFTLMDLIVDSMFFKFQTRLSELEEKHGKLATRVHKPFVNRFNHKSSCYIYKAIDKQKIREIYDNS